MFKDSIDLIDNENKSDIKANLKKSQTLRSFGSNSISKSLIGARSNPLGKV